MGACRTNLNFCSLRPRRLVHCLASAGVSALRSERARRNLSAWREGHHGRLTCVDTVALSRAGPHLALRATFSRERVREKEKGMSTRFNMFGVRSRSTTWPDELSRPLLQMKAILFLHSCRDPPPPGRSRTQAARRPTTYGVCPIIPGNSPLSPGVKKYQSQRRRPTDESRQESR